MYDITNGDLMYNKPTITEEFIHTDASRYPDSIELGKSGSRLTVRFNADDLEDAIRRIDEALLVRDYAINSLLKSIENEITQTRAKK